MKRILNALFFLAPVILLAACSRPDYIPAHLLGLYCGTEGMVRVETEGKVIRMPV